MLATLAGEPFHRKGWIYEEKYDGWRMLAFKDGDTVRLISRNGLDHTRRFAELAFALARLAPERLILDGEVCVFDENLVSQFHLLGQGTPDEVATPRVYMAFDCLYVDGRDLRPTTLARRRDVLDAVLDGGDLILPARRLSPDGLNAWDIVKTRGYEGLVAKDEQSMYGTGRTRSWLKVKVRYEGIFTVGGILGRRDSFDGVLVGERVGRRLLYRGVVEWGIGRVTAGELLTRCRVAEASPFHDLPRARRATWLEPKVRISVTYNEMMQGRLRDPVFRGLSGGSPWGRASAPARAGRPASRAGRRQAV